MGINNGPHIFSTYDVLRANCRSGRYKVHDMEGTGLFSDDRHYHRATIEGQAPASDACLTNEKACYICGMH